MKYAVDTDHKRVYEEIRSRDFPKFDVFGQGNDPFFLTPTGKKSERSLNWIPLSHKDLITIGMCTLSAGGISSLMEG